MKALFRISLFLFSLTVTSAAFSQEALRKVETLYPDGKKKETFYVDENGKKSGSYIMYYENGKKALEITFSDGKKNGFLRSWHRNGKISEESKYSNDQRVSFSAYDELGNLVEKSSTR